MRDVEDVDYHRGEVAVACEQHEALHGGDHHLAGPVLHGNDDVVLGEDLLGLGLHAEEHDEGQELLLGHRVGAVVEARLRQAPRSAVLRTHVHGVHPRRDDEDHRLDVLQHLLVLLDHVLQHLHDLAELVELGLEDGLDLQLLDCLLDAWRPAREADLCGA